MVKTKTTKTIIFADNFDIRLITDAIHLPRTTNLETFLNDREQDELILEGVTIQERDKASGQYKPLSTDDLQAIKISHIVLVCGLDKERLFAPTQQYGNQAIIPVKFRLEGLERGLISGVNLPGNHVPQDDVTKLVYINKQLRDKRFIPFYAPHQKPGQSYFLDLFTSKGRRTNPALQRKLLDRILLNRTDYSVYTTSIPKE